MTKKLNPQGRGDQHRLTDGHSSRSKKEWNFRPSAFCPALIQYKNTFTCYESYFKGENNDVDALRSLNSCPGGVRLRPIRSILNLTSIKCHILIHLSELVWPPCNIFTRNNLTYPAPMYSTALPRFLLPCAWSWEYRWFWYVSVSVINWPYKVKFRPVAITTNCVKKRSWKLEDLLHSLHNIPPDS